jgi:hypothetical protein
MNELIKGGKDVFAKDFLYVDHLLDGFDDIESKHFCFRSAKYD